MKVVERRCGPPASQFSSSYRFTGQSPEPFIGRVAGDAANSAPIGFSVQALAIADTILVLPLIRQLPELEAEIAQNGEGAALRLMRVRQQLSDRLLLALFDVSVAAAEAHCEEERANQLANRLQETRDNRVRQDTIYAIVGGATVGIVAGGLNIAAQSLAGAIAAVFGGSLEASFGFKALFQGMHYDYHHGVDLLQEVWEGPEQSSRFPTSVWQFLNRPLPDDPTGPSVREALLARWKRDGWLGEPNSERTQRRIKLFFGKGGAYEIEDLRAHAAMLDLLESDIRLMAQELHLLLREVLSRDAV